jgi:hypothetical protein
MMHLSIRAILAVAFILALAGPAEAAKKTRKEIALDKCDDHYINCTGKCDRDKYGKDRRDCNNKCSIRHARCSLDAGARGQIEQGTSPGSSEILESQ